MAQDANEPTLTEQYRRIAVEAIVDQMEWDDAHDYRPDPMKAGALAFFERLGPSVEELHEELIALVPSNRSRGGTVVEVVTNYIADLEAELATWINGDVFEQLVVDKRKALQQAASWARKAKEIPPENCEQSYACCPSGKCVYQFQFESRYLTPEELSDTM